MLEQLKSQTEDSRATQISNIQKLLPSLGLEGQRKGPRLPMGTVTAEGAGILARRTGWLVETRTVRETHPLPEHCLKRARERFSASPLFPPSRIQLPTLVGQTKMKVGWQGVSGNVICRISPQSYYTTPGEGKNGV